MKKLYLFIILVVFIFIGCIETNQVTDLQSMNLNKSIKKIIEINIKVLNDNKLDTIQKSIIKFNKKGFIVSQNDTFYKIRSNQLIKDKYNMRNQLIEQSFYNSSLGYTIKTLYDHKSDDFVIISAFNNKDSLVSKIKIKYNSNGQILNEKGHYYFNDSLYYEANYEYNNKNQIISKDMTNSDSLLNNNRIEYKGNIENNPSEILFFNKNGNLIYKNIYKYKFDNFNNWVTKLEYQDSILYRKYIRIYSYY